MNYKQLFKKGRLGVKFTNSADCKNFIKPYGDCLDKEVRLSVANWASCSPVVLYDYNGELNVADEDYNDLVKIIDYKKYIECSEKETDPKELFEVGALGVRTFNVEERKNLIKLCGEDPNKSEWNEILLRVENIPVIFCADYGELLSTCEEDVDLVDIMDYKDFTRAVKTKTNDLISKLEKLKQRYKYEL